MKKKNTNDPFEPKDVKSRRGGPAKEPLSRDAIVQAALELLLREGPQGMSLRKVAAVLETGAASLYAYVENLEELEALVCDRGLAAVKTTGSRKLDWRARLVALLRSYLLVLMRTPGLAQLAMKTIAIGPHALRILEAQLALLEEGGIDRGTAAWATDLLTLYVTAIAAEQSERDKQSNPLGPVARVIETISAERYPNIFAAREELLSGGANRMTWALEVLIKGILETPRSHSKAKAHKHISEE
jgi:AcrR family transcriptional regulator